MHTRRYFLSRAAAFGGTLGLLESVQRALAIDPPTGSSFWDAEHVVILMQENRSFDHAYGTLRGVRGFDDPRAISLPDGNPVWVQANAAGERFVPFRFDINDTKITWMGSLPHGWSDQVDARNKGLYDRWLTAKRSGASKLPLTLGYYSRADIPFYYALADAFTICDQYFCSSLTGTTPNRLYLWSGTIRERPSADSPAHVLNEEADLNHLVSWPTFPERLEDLGVSWRVYQNELTVDSGLTGEEDAWLANFGDNPLEYLRQYHVHLAPQHRDYVERRIREIPAEIDVLKQQLAEPNGDGNSAARLKRVVELTTTLKRLQAERDRWPKKQFDQLSTREKAIHARAFCTNAGDPSYRGLANLTYRDGNQSRTLRAPKGDLFHQFRADVASGKLPTVSWLVAPEKVSDHPSAAWYGAWYVSEAIDILTRNPDVWKKTIFMLTYDENDGYFDHVPPFVAPHPRRPETGRVTKGIDASVEYVELEQDRKRHFGWARESSIGLGYRVPMVIASPWSRGGCVCSQVFDHTSVIQFLEKLLSRKLRKKVEEPNISRWRRTVCGDLTASFRSAVKDRGVALIFPQREAFLQSIHRAQFKGPPTGSRPLTPEEIAQIRRDPAASPLLPRQEPGVRPSSPLPYQLAVDGALDERRTQFVLQMSAHKDVFGDWSAGAPFTAYILGRDGMSVRNYAVEAGESLTDAWPLVEFEGGKYHIRVYGPNGFFREFTGGPDDALVEVRFHEVRSAADKMPSGAVRIEIANRDPSTAHAIEVRDNAYGHGPMSKSIKPGGDLQVAIDGQKSRGWYDLSVRVAGPNGFAKRYAGRIETGQWTSSDPAIGTRK